MSFTRNNIFAIAKEKYNLGGDKSNSKINYEKWVQFIDDHSEEFIWNENTKTGKETLANIESVPESFKERVLISLNKGACYKEYDYTKGYFNINIGFNFVDNFITIGFERTPRLEDLIIFVEMAKYLEAYLLVDGTQIIDEEYLEKNIK
jgi:hypothetical protein